MVEVSVATGKFLTFQVAKEVYGVEILKIREIIGMVDITPVPHTPFFIKGVINLRGKVIAVIDLRAKFGLQETDYTRETCMVIVDLKGKQLGLIVDAVHEVINIDASNIDETPSFGIEVRTDFIMGLGKLDDNVVVILLDIDKVLTSDEVISVEAIAEQL